MQRSKVNPDLVNAVFKTGMVPKWSGTKYRPYKLVSLDPKSSSDIAREYRLVTLNFSLTYPFGIILHIQRIENPYLMGQYLLEKQQKMEEYPLVKDVVLFHGTCASNVDSIAARNFNWRLSGQVNGHKFGHGIYFTSNGYEASRFSETNTVFLGRVLVASTTEGLSSTKVPPKGFDTTKNDDGTIFMKYTDHEYYPEYVITCRCSCPFCLLYKNSDCLSSLIS